MKNPFIVSGFAGKSYFCDRENELRELRAHLDNDRNVVLFSWRRMGKTSLIQYLLRQMVDEAETIYIDLLATRNASDALKAITNATYQRFGKTQKGLSETFLQLIGQLGLKLSFDPNTGFPSFGFSVHRSTPPERSLQTIGTYLSSRKKKVIVAIDEFQQVTHYQEQNGEALFRQWMQEFPEIRFIFSGSHRGIMTSMFTSEKRPFYRSAQLLSLDAIPFEEYAPFIRNHFSRAKKEITEKSIEEIYAWCKGQTYSIQLICNKLYGKFNRIGSKQVDEVMEEILNQESLYFSQLSNLLTDVQWKVLHAIGKGEEVKNPLASEFLQEYELSAASSVSTALNALQKKELVVRENEFYRVHDLLLMRWLQRQH
jgi:hypothetical protein